MPRRLGQFKQAAALLTIAVLAGCQGAPLAKDDTWLAYPEALGRPRSIVFPSLAMRRLVAEHNEDAAIYSQPWYATRNDARLTISAGYRSATTDRVVNVTYDRQTISNGRVRDQYNSATYRQTVTHTVR